MHFHRSSVAVALAGAVAVIGSCCFVLAALAVERDQDRQTPELAVIGSPEMHVVLNLDCGGSPGGCESDEDCADGDQCTDEFCNEFNECESVDNGVCCEAFECAGDVNGDGLVNSLDSGSIHGRWGLDPCNEENCKYDVNCDGLINPLDNGFVLARFSTCQEPEVCKICE